MSRLIVFLCTACFCLIQVVAGHGQVRVTGADLRGVVRDSSGLVLQSAAIVATNLETGISRPAQTDSQGRYLIAALVPGSYRVAASADGFATDVRDGVTVLLGQLVSIDFVLALATLRTTVTVVPTAPVISADRTVVSSVIDRSQIETLPSNGRNFIDFAALLPGVVRTGLAGPGAETSGLSFAGQRPRANNLMVDGLDDNDRILGGSQASVSQEAVREFQVLTSSYSAEFGQATGGVVNIVTKSGTNERSGNVFVFHRNEHLNASDHFERFDVFETSTDRGKAPYRQYQWGGTLGGPLRRDRTFYFLSLEKLDVRAHNFVNIDPAAAAVLGDFGFPIELGNVPYDVRTTQAQGKATHHWTAGRFLTLTGHLSDVTNENFRSYGGLTARSHGVMQLREDWAFSASQTDVWGASWVNEGRVQWARQEQLTRALDPRCGGPCVTESQGGPEVVVPGVAIVGRNINEPTERDNWRLQVSDVVSHAAGRHTLKVGGSFIYISQEARTPLEFGGSHTFAPLPAIPGLLPGPLTGLQAFEFGLPAVSVQGFGNSAGPFTYKEVSTFVQDDWRVTPRVTLKAGVRYQAQLWPAIDTTVSDVAGNTLTYPFPQDHNNFAPRIGVAIDLTGDGLTSARGSYGIFYGNQLATLLGSNIVFDGSPSGIRLLVLPFPASISAWQAPDHRLPEPNVPFPSSVVTVAPDLESPFSHQGSVGLSHALGDDLFLSVDFVQVRGRNQGGSLNYNPFVPSLGLGRRPNDVGGIAGTSADVFQFTDFGVTWYRGLLVSLQRRLSDNYQFMASYTLSKAENNSSEFIGHVEDGGRGRNPANRRGLPLGFRPESEKGPAGTDQRHRLALSGSYVFPRQLQVAAIIMAASACPFTPLAGADLNGDGLPFADRARKNPLDPTTSVGRNSERMGAEMRVDVRVSKRFTFASGVSFEALVEVFNLFNRTNFVEINNVFGPGAFPSQPLRDRSGRITYGLFEKAQPPRQLQVGGKFTF